jgi:uncharacterized protein YcfL
MAFDDPQLDLKKQQAELKIQQTEYSILQFFRTMPIWWRWLSASAIILIIPGFFISKYTTSAVYSYTLAKTEVLVHTAQVVSLPVKVENTAAVLINGTNYAAYAQVKNQNSSQASPDLNYTFHFLDTNGVELNTSSGTDTLLPGEEKYIVVPRVTLKSAPAKITVDITPGTWQNRTNIPNITFISNTPNGADVPEGGYAINATVLNQSMYTLGTITINGFAYNASGQLIAIMQTTVNTVSPQENRAYRLFWPVAIANSVANIKVFPETNSLDSSNVQ